MQDQGRRLLIAVVLAFGVLFLWGKIFPREEPPTTTSEVGSQAAPKPSIPAVGVPAGGSAAPGPASASATGSTGPGTPAPATPSPAGKPASELPRPPEQTITLPFENFVATFSSYCGGLASWQLT